MKNKITAEEAAEKIVDGEMGLVEAILNIEEKCPKEREE